MKSMKQIQIKMLILFLIAVFLLNFINAIPLNITNQIVHVNGLDVGSNNVSVIAGKTYPLTFQFTAQDNIENVEIYAWINNERQDTVGISLGDLINGNNYMGKLNILIPKDVKPGEKLIIHIRLEGDTGNWEGAYFIYVKEILYPEAVIIFNPTTKNIEVTGIGEGDIKINYKERCMNKKCNIKRVSYTLKDNYNNTLLLKLLYTKNNNYINFQVLKLKYNNKDKIKIKDNHFFVDGFKDLNRLHQEIYLKNNFKVSADYNKKFNKTIISINEENQTSKDIKNGLVLIKLITNKGSLNYNF